MEAVDTFCIFISQTLTAVPGAEASYRELRDIANNLTLVE